MKNSKQFASKLASHIKKLKKRTDPLEMADPVDVLVYSQLLWEADTTRADEWWGRLADERLDWHELRVSTAEEIATMCGDKSALGEERASRLRSMLNHLYQRHHDVTLMPEMALGKRDMRDAIESLDGITPFVANRWLLLCGDVGGIPVDDQLRWMLVNAGCLDDGASLTEAASWVSRQVKSDTAWDTHAKLQAWVNGQSDRVAKKRVKDVQAELRSAKKRRSDAQSVRHDAQEIARQKRAEAAARAAARKAAAEKAAQEEAAELSRPTNVKKKTTKKPAPKKKTTKKAAAKKTTKKATGKKKTTKKSASKKKTSKKAAAKKKTTKKSSKKSISKKKTSKKSAAKKKQSKKSASKKRSGRTR